MNDANETHAALGKAVITGASAGIGKVYSDRLAARGYDLLLIARRGQLLQEVAEAIRAAHGVNVETLVADLGIAADLDTVADRIANDPAISLLVNNAGTSKMASVAETGAAATSAMTELNITALARLSLAVLPGFKQRDHGTLINIGSVLGFHSLPISSVYSATKGYVLNFTRGLTEEVAGTGVKVQLVLPAATATDLWDIAGVPISALDPDSVMTVENCVDAALAGLDLGETVTLPSVEDGAALLEAYDTARMSLLGASQTGKPASRYKVAA